MIKLTVLYGHPQDPAEFDRYYRETHTPLALKFPGLQGITVDRPTSLNPQEQSPYYLIANLYWADMQSFQEALNSPEGQAGAADLANFATGGATLLVGEMEVPIPVSLS
ncbi:MAG TPA: EthD family reductase [Ktedonobacteraceae bacterium]|jgi:uncharacterized protein (TIGR02118 family)|nr:EthD family reductase [Ktedonobacteraceae bacterium]